MIKPKRKTQRVYMTIQKHLSPDEAQTIGHWVALFPNCPRVNLKVLSNMVGVHYYFTQVSLLLPYI